jgi:hypothetical protein
MVKNSNVRVALRRLLLTLSVVPLLVVSTGCGLFSTHKRIQVPQLLSPVATANRDFLINEVNRLANVKSIHSKVDIQFEDTSFALVGVADQFRQVDGTVTLQNPGKIFLAIQFSFVDIAQMASDGEHFSVAVLKGDEKYKRFVKGTNNAVYAKLDTGNGTTSANQDPKKKEEKQTVSALSNLRPQHLTDAFMIPPIDRTGKVYSLSEFFQEEPDMRVGAKKGARVMRPYYLMEEMSEPKDGQAQVLRRFWFDRVVKIRLARVQSYDEKGVLITDVSYFNEQPIGADAAVSLPTRVQITRPQDQYKLSINYQDAGSVSVNREWPVEAFVLQNKWQLPEVDLDAQNSKKVSANH